MRATHFIQFSSKRHNRGLSLIELLTGLCISAVLLSQAVPALERMKQRQRLNLHAQTLMMDLKHARHEALLGSENVNLLFEQQSQGACYIVYTGPSKQCHCDASGTPVCTGGAKAIKSQWLPSQHKIGLKTKSSHLSFSAKQGAVTPTASIDLSTQDGDSIRQIISVAGRVRSCSPNASMGQYPAC